MYCFKSLLAIFILFYIDIAIAIPCADTLESKGALRKNIVNGNSRANTSNGVEAKPEVHQETETTTQDTWDMIWNSLFQPEGLISKDDIPQLTRERQITLMYEIMEKPEYSIFDAKERVRWLKVLFANGIDVNTQNASKDTPLHIAARMRGITGRYLVNFLLKNKADVRLENHLGRTPLDVAYAYSNQEIAEILQKQI